MQRTTYRISDSRGILSVVIALTVLLCEAIHADRVLDTYATTMKAYVYTGTSPVQGVRPLASQRAVRLDGTPMPVGDGADQGGGQNDNDPDIIITPPTVSCGGSLNGGSLGGGVGFGGNTNEPQIGMATLGGIDLFNGTFPGGSVDLRLSGPGLTMAVTRSHNSRQKNSGGSYFDSSGYQGANWFQGSQPEIRFYDDATSAANDVVYLILGAGSYVEFKREDAASDEFKSKNGAAGVVQFTAAAGGEPEIYRYVAPNGVEVKFFGFDGNAGTAAGQFWKVTERLGNMIYAGDSTTASTAISSGFSSGKLTTLYQTLDSSRTRRLTYTYTSNQLTSVVVAEKPSGGAYANTNEKVEYAYYVNADTHGEDGDLKLVTITTPLSDNTSGTHLVRKTHYRYYEGSYHATTNPGYLHQIKMVVSAEGTRRYDAIDAVYDDNDFVAASDADLKPYAASFFEYDTDRKIKKAWFNGACGCGGGSIGNGVHEFTYELNTQYSDNTSAYDNAESEWYSRTVIKKPDSSYVTQYFDEVAQPLHTVVTALVPTDTSGSQKVWATRVIRDADAVVTEVNSPGNVTGYTHANDGTWGFTKSTSAGLVTVYTRVASPDELQGFISDVKHKTGTSGSAYLDRTYTYEERDLIVDDVTVTRPLVASSRVYTEPVTSGTSGSRLTSLTYTYWSSTGTSLDFTAVKKIVSTHPAVSTGNNGSNSSTTTTRYVRKDGTTAFTESADGTFTYTQYRDGTVVTRIDDVKTNDTTDIAVSVDDPNGIWGITESGTGEHRKTSISHDTQGRVVTRTLEQGSNDRVYRTYISRLKDFRLVTLQYNDYDTTPKFYGPVSYTVTNLAGQVEVQAVVALTSNESTTALSGHVDETDADPITAMDLGTVAQMSTNIYSTAGTQLSESRAYFLIPGSGAGTEGTNFDATYFGYDDSGRRRRVKDPTGTIRRTVFDAIGRVSSSKLGTNDYGEAGGEGSGPNNMVTVSEVVYDSGGDKGNSFVTKRTLFIQDSATGDRETTFAHDVKGRVILQTNPPGTDPKFVLNKYDHMGRLIASGSYTGDGSGDVTSSDDPTSRTTDRLALSQTFYDERGQVWKTQRHKIDAADGSDDDNLQTLTWYDADGQVIKVDGEQLTKTIYDRLGRATHSFVLANMNDSVYADADDVSGDKVLQETQTTYDTNTGEVIMTATIDRFYDDSSGTGALDTNADADALLYTETNVDGRIQITATWYDNLGRMTDTVSYGTYGMNGAGANNFDRDGLSVPARSDTALLTEYDYNTDGTLKEVVDPRNLTTRYEYDPLGRQTAVISNYVNGTPSGATGDDDNFVRYVYTDGLRTQMWVDIDGDNVQDAGVDQVTTYTYGVAKGASAGDSKIASGSLLYKVVYPDPDGTEADKRVLNAYNAQGQVIWTKDQAGNIIETDYDDSGKMTHRRATTIVTGDGFDDLVKRISMTYDSLGRVSLITQYDNATVGSGSVLNEIKNSYELAGWGSLTKHQFDRDSAVGGSGYYEVSYAFEKATTGRNTIRRTTQTLPDGNVITYTYRTGIDADSSRVSEVKDGSVILASYSYNGVGHVVATNLSEADVMWKMHGASSSSFPDLDRFNRVTSSRWTKDLATDVDFFDLDITYDRNSNITLVEDNIYGGVDVAYTIDNLNRLVKAKEGTWTPGTGITSMTREQLWQSSGGGGANMLDQLGNWEQARLDLNGNGNFGDTVGAVVEYDDDRTHNTVNELTGRDTDDNGTDNYTLVYDKVGNLTDDGQSYTYVYDAFGRLRKIKNRSNAALVEEFWYDGSNRRVAWKSDSEPDGDVDASDKTYYVKHDERWRIVGVFRESDTSAKETFVYHNAGASGYGNASYIDDVILRDRDHNSGWTSAADGTLEQRRYYCQNWRHDVLALIKSDGKIAERDRYVSYGTPFGSPLADATFDGTVNASDTTQVNTDWGANYHVRSDFDLSGTVGAADLAEVTANNGKTLGWGTLSDATNVANRKGYAGYEIDIAISKLYHVRYRVLSTELGRWMRRDPSGYVDGLSVVAYARSNPLAGIDPFGRETVFYMCRDLEGALGLIGIHCFVVVCINDPIYPDLYDFESGNCIAYSLLNRDGSVLHDRNNHHDILADWAIHGWSSATSQQAACIHEAFRLTKQQYDGRIYDPFSCNSNWFAAHLWNCCMCGFQSIRGDLGDWSGRCCPDEVGTYCKPFICPSISPCQGWAHSIIFPPCTEP